MDKQILDQSIQSLFGILLFELNYLTNWIRSSNGEIQLISRTRIITTFMPDIFPLIYPWIPKVRAIAELTRPPLIAVRLN